MSDRTVHIPQVAEYYDDLYMLNGAVMDKNSYEKHTAAMPAVPPETTTAASVSSPEPDVAESDPFCAPQDLRQMAAQAFEADQQVEYRPETAVFVPYTIENGEYYEYVPTTETVCENTFHLLLGAPTRMRLGSGSYRTSGSYRLSSGSYRLTSGSYRLSSGSYRLTSGSYRLTSGFYRLSSGSFRLSHSSFRPTSGSFRLSSGAFRRTSGSFQWLLGSFRRTSGSFRWSSGSFRPTSGSFRWSSGSFRRTSGSFRLSSGSFRVPNAAPHNTFNPLETSDKPYMGSFLWGMDAGGYGLNLI